MAVELTVDDFRAAETALAGRLADHGGAGTPCRNLSPNRTSKGVVELPEADINGLAGIAGQTFDAPDDERDGERKLVGWPAYMRNLGVAYPDAAATAAETLDWGASTAVSYNSGAGEPIIRSTGPMSAFILLIVADISCNPTCISLK